MARSVKRQMLPLPLDLAEHIRARQRLETIDRACYPADPQFRIGELEAWALSAGAEVDPTGQYLEVLVRRLAWWLGAVDLALSGSSDLPRLRALLAEVAASIGPAWAESHVHSGGFAVQRARKLIRRYCVFRCAVVAAITAACPGADLSALRELA